MAVSKRSDETQLAIVSTTLDYIKKDIGEIKVDVRLLKDSGFITRSEVNTLVSQVEESITDKIAPIYRAMVGLAAFILFAVLGSILRLVLL